MRFKESVNTCILGFYLLVEHLYLRLQLLHLSAQFFILKLKLKKGEIYLGLIIAWHNAKSDCKKWLASSSENPNKNAGQTDYKNDARL